MISGLFLLASLVSLATCDELGTTNVTKSYFMTSMVELPGGCGTDSYCGSYQYHGVQTHGVFNADLDQTHYIVNDIKFKFFDSSDSGHTSTWDDFSCDLFKSSSDITPLMDCSAQSGSGWQTRTVPTDKLHLLRNHPAPQKIQVTNTKYGSMNGDYFYNPWYSAGHYTGYKWVLYVTGVPVCSGCDLGDCVDYASCSCRDGGVGATCGAHQCSMDGFADHVGLTSCSGPYTSQYGDTAMGSTCQTTISCPPMHTQVGTPGVTVTCQQDTSVLCNSSQSCDATWSEDPTTLGYCDPDECALGIDNCHAEATCTDKLGGFTCECKDGFSGDGVTCEVNRCDAPSLATGIERTCTGPLVDEYGVDTENATCTLVDGCSSLGPYVRVGDLATIQCLADSLEFESFETVYCDEDKCQSGANDCHQFADCTYSVGSFSCSCPDLFHGTGQFCAVEQCPALEPNAGTFVACGGDLNEVHGDNVVTSTCTVTDECAENFVYVEPAGTSVFTCERDASVACAEGGDASACDTAWSSPLSQLPYCDPDECALGTDTCHADATCKNTPTGYTCTCNEGYSGDGESCVDIDECADGVANECAAASVCTNLKGSYECKCLKDGYVDPEGLGYICDDVNECEDETLEDGCVANAVCVNVDGAKNKCECANGYAGNGFVECADVDECATKTDSCSDVGSVCINNVGSHECACVNGFVDVGVTDGKKAGEVCEDVDECAADDDNVCTTAADGGVCTNTVGSYECGCADGFRLVEGSATECEDIDECEEFGRDVLCHESARCVNLDGSHRCSCLDGLLGDGVVSCVNGDDVETQVAALVEVHMDVACSDFVADEFVTNLATFLSVSRKRIVVTGVRCASVHAKVALLEPQEVDASELQTNDRVAASELAASLETKLTSSESSWFVDQYSVVGAEYGDATADVLVDKTKQQVYVPPRQEDAAGSGADKSVDEAAGSSTTDVAVIVAVVVVLVVLLIAVAVTARRRVAEAHRLNSMEEAGGTYLAPTATSGGTTGSGTMAALASMRRDKTLRSSSSTAGGAGDYDEAPRAGKTARAPDEFLAGKVLIPADELVRDVKIGEGAFGLVFKGQWGEKAVAIKEVKGTNAEAIKQLVDEGERLSQIPPHDNVVTFYGVCAEPMGVVLQFCAKGALLDKLYGSDSSKFYEFSLAELQALTLGIAAGLKHLHSVQVIHRDVATRNVLIDENGVAKLTDFGMSRDQEEGAEYVQQTKTSTGPLKWMAPEQMVDRIVSSKADMYSFGIVMWEMYARSEPWPGVMALQAAGNVMAGKQHAVAEETTPMAAAIMLACLDKDMHARPSAERVVKGATAEWGSDGSTVDGEAVGAGAKENPAVLALKAKHFAELPKEEDDAVYLAPPTKPKASVEDGYGAPPKKGAATGVQKMEKRSSSRRHGKTPRSSSPTH